ncbi:MAG: peptide-methionine (R)-S-oxide reductase [Streptococcus salivarius]
MSPEAYTVTQENGTERGLQVALWNHFEPGIYVDGDWRATLSSKDKFDSACGWQVSRPISPEVANYKEDHSQYGTH